MSTIALAIDGNGLREAIVYAKRRTFIPISSAGGRAEASARVIERALLDLLSLVPFDRVTISSIADRCSLARSTVYRKFADTRELLWAVTAPTFTSALRIALAADKRSFVQIVGELWDSPGLACALVSPGAHLLRRKLAEVVSAEIERSTRRRDASACGLVVSGAWFALIEEHAGDRLAPEDALSELMSLIYVSAFLTPEGLGAAARHRSEHLGEAFPAAVSARESLADRSFIISMIDGRRYRSLTRHIARYGMTPEHYRRCFSLPVDYPMVAPAYSERRREIASSAHFGSRRTHASSEQDAGSVSGRDRSLV